MSEFSECDRAVSEVFGFILLFSIIILSIGAVSVFGVNSLSDGKDAALVNNMERGFDGMASTIDELDPGLSRSTSFQPRSGTIRFEGTTRVQVHIGGASGRTVLDESVTPIVYEYNEQQLVYAASAVFRLQRDSGVIVTPPSFRLSESKTIMTVPRTEPIRSMSVSGGTANIQFSGSAPSAPVLDTGSKRVQIIVKSPTDLRADLWERALEKTLEASSTTHTCVRPSPDKVTCEYTTDAGASILARPLLVEVDLS